MEEEKHACEGVQEKGARTCIGHMFSQPMNQREKKQAQFAATPTTLKIEHKRA